MFESSVSSKLQNTIEENYQVHVAGVNVTFSFFFGHRSYMLQTGAISHELH